MRKNPFPASACIAAVAALLPLAGAQAQTGGGTAPPAAPVPSKPAVLAAIARMMRVVGEGGTAMQTPSGTADKVWADDMKLVARFAQDSPDTTITIMSSFYAADSKGAGPLLIAYYLAGAVRYDLQHPAKATDPYADQASAVRAELLAYRYTQKRGPKRSVPLLDNLQKMETTGNLDKYVAGVAAQDAKTAKANAPKKQ